jgi:glycogen(starch) synthase
MGGAGGEPACGTEMTEGAEPGVVSADAPVVRRVLMTADAVGGVWHYVLDLAAALRDRGIEPLIALLGPSPSTDQRQDASSRGLQVVEHPCRLEWMEDPWSDVNAAGEWLLDLADAFSPDLVHLNGYCHAGLPWCRPVVVVAHSCVRSWWRAVHGTGAPASWARYSTEVARGLTAASLVVAPTAAMLEMLRDEYGGPGEARVIPNAIHGEQGRAYSAAPAKADLVFAAGRLWDEAKNIGALCRVASRLEWPVYVAGENTSPSDGGQEPMDSVHWLGRLPARRISEWYERAAIYALPARYEPFGLSVLEAAAQGCALVLGDIASLRENWDDAAVFVAPGDEEHLARAIRDLIADPSRRQALGAEAMRRAAEFTIARMAAAYIDAYAVARARRAAEGAHPRRRGTLVTAL